MITMAPTIAATAARRAPPATPPSVANRICPELLLVLLPLAATEQLAQEVAVLVLVPAGTGAVALN